MGQTRVLAELLRVGTDTLDAMNGSSGQFTSGTPRLCSVLIKCNAQASNTLKL